MQDQFEELAKQKLGDSSNSGKRSKMVVIGQNCVEPLQALRSSGHEVLLSSTLSLCLHSQLFLVCEQFLKQDTDTLMFYGKFARIVTYHSDSSNVADSCNIFLVCLW